MKLKSIAKNQTEIEFKNGSYTITILFSYQTPVAIHIKKDIVRVSKFFTINPHSTKPPGYKWPERILVTQQKISATTTRHINAFIARYPGDVMNVNQESIVNVLDFYTDK